MSPDAPSPDRPEGMLSPFRALDLTDGAGALGGRVLADLGADVIKVEPAGGDSARGLGPFYQDQPHPERSLSWFALNANKRGITLELASGAGRALLLRLVERSDFVFESFPPGALAAWGLGFDRLRAVNPRLVLVSITPFGQTGPYAGYRATDIVAMALSGYMYLCGDADRPPVRISAPQAFLHAGADAAAAALIAHYERQSSGQGQWVDVSAQESLMGAMMNARPFWDLNQVNLQRSGPLRSGLANATHRRQTWPCREGSVAFAVTAGPTGARNMRGLLAWMAEEGAAPPALLHKDWDAFDMALAPQAEIDAIEDPVLAFFARHTPAELFHQALKRRVILYPVSTTADLLQDGQLAARAFWTRVEHPALGATLTYPGPFIRMSEATCGLRRPPPSIGQHNHEVYQGELGLSDAEMRALAEAGVI